jgi:hypothetical protein
LQGGNYDYDQDGSPRSAAGPIAARWKTSTITID